MASLKHLNLTTAQEKLVDDYIADFITDDVFACFESGGDMKHKIRVLKTAWLVLRDKIEEAGVFGEKVGEVKKGVRNWIVESTGVPAWVFRQSDGGEGEGEGEEKRGRGREEKRLNEGAYK